LNKNEQSSQELRRVDYQPLLLLARHEPPRLTELAIFPSEPFNLIFHFHVVSLVELSRQGVHFPSD
jgi:hypothetical protein